MKSFKSFIDEGKKCGDGEYYCHEDKKCKKIPRGYRVGYGGYLRKENESNNEDSENGKNGNGGSNGNGNGSSSNGGGSNGGGNGGGNGGSGGGE